MHHQASKLEQVCACECWKHEIKLTIWSVAPESSTINALFEDLKRKLFIVRKLECSFVSIPDRLPIPWLVVVVDPLLDLLYGLHQWWFDSLANSSIFHNALVEKQFENCCRMSQVEFAALVHLPSSLD